MPPRQPANPLPTNGQLVEDVIGKLRGCKHLTKLDIISAFNKLRMSPESEDLTTFVTTFGTYKYRVRPFDLTIGPASFQQYINDVLFEHLDEEGIYKVGTPLDKEYAEEELSREPLK